MSDETKRLAACVLSLLFSCAALGSLLSDTDLWLYVTIPASIGVVVLMRVIRRLDKEEFDRLMIRDRQYIKNKGP